MKKVIGWGIYFAISLLMASASEDRSAGHAVYAAICVALFLPGLLLSGIVGHYEDTGWVFLGCLLFWGGAFLLMRRPRRTPPTRAPEPDWGRITLRSRRITRHISED